MRKLLLLLLLFSYSTAFCQTPGVSITATGVKPDASAILDVSSTNKGSLIPRMSKAQRDAISNPTLGLQIYDTTTRCFEAYGYGSWQTLSCLCTGAPSAPGAITGTGSVCAHATNLVFSVPLVLNVTSYVWTVPSDATIIAGQGSNSITVNFGVNSGTITAKASNSCGTSSAATLLVNIVTTPSTPGAITGNAYPCANASAQAFSVAVVNNATSYNWSVPSGANIAFGQGTNSILVNFSSTPGNISVTAVNACGSSSASVLAITMPSAAPASPGVIHGNATFTPNQSGVLYYVAPVSNANSYTWSVPSDATITSGQGTDSIKITFGSISGNICVTATNCVGTSSSCITVHNSCYSSGTQTFNYTGSQQAFTVPCGVPWVDIAAYGAQGGGGQYIGGGLGGSASGTLSVAAGTVLYVFVGGQNGYNGGGTGAGGWGNGGGESDVRVGGNAIANWVIVAGGGGGVPFQENELGGIGGGGNICTYGAGGSGGLNPGGGPAGAGTCTNGGNAGAQYSPGGTPSSGGGGGGGLTGGGLGSSEGGYTGGSGTKGQGGNAAVSAACTPYKYGAGGGGGYYGGGGTASGDCGTAGGGGGGSCWATSSMTNLLFSGVIQAGDGKVVITW